MAQHTDNARRKAIAGAFKLAGLASLGAIAGGVASKAKPNGVWLRPPAALDEKSFVASCIRCGLCVEACPPRALKLADMGDKAPLGTPFFVASENPCVMCPDIPCVPICPTNALDEKLVTGEDGKLSIEKAKMGVAVVDSEHCVAFFGNRCEVCYAECPVRGAIVLDIRRNERTGRHAMMIPVVDNTLCTGCGKCEKACITAKPAIFVLPPESFGADGSHYAKGWDLKDQERIEREGGAHNVSPTSSKGAQDYLNDGEL